MNEILMWVVLAIAAMSAGLASSVMVAAGKAERAARRAAEKSGPGPWASAYVTGRWL